MRMFYAIFFGAGAAAVAYTRLGRRVGYENGRSVWTLIGIIFILTTIIFYTILATLGV